MPLYRVRHQQGERGLVVVWSQRRLLLVDPSPDTEAPPWINTEWVMPDGNVIRATPEGPCAWRQAGERGA